MWRSPLRTKRRVMLIEPGGVTRGYPWEWRAPPEEQRPPRVATLLFHFRDGLTIFENGQTKVVSLKIHWSSPFHVKGVSLGHVGRN